MGIFRLVRVVCCCLVGLLFVSQLTFASTRTVYAEPSDFQRAYTAGTGGQSHVDSRNWNADVQTGQGSSSTAVQTRRGYGWNSFKGVAKNAAKGGVAGVMGSLALGYLMDQIPGGEIVDGQAVKQPAPGPETYFAANVYNAPAGYVPTRHGSPQEACEAIIPTPPEPWYWNKRTQVASPTQAYCYQDYSYQYCPSCGNQLVGYAQQHDLDCGVFGAALIGFTCNESAPELVPFSDFDWDSLFDNAETIPPAYIPPVVAEIDNSPYAFTSPDTYDFTGPSQIEGQPTVTTSTNPSTGTTTTTEHLPSTQLEYGVDPLTITTTEVSTTTTYTDGAVTNVTNTSNYSPTPAPSAPATPAVEVPTDCAFMPTVCEFIGWVKTPFEEPEPDLSDLIDNDQDFERSVSFASNASCPAPLVFNTSKGDYPFSLEPACQWMGYMKPLIIIAALISAVFISLGAFRGGD